MGKVLFMRKGETHTTPSVGILASDLAVGSTVKLMESGVATEYLIVHKGNPSSLYDTSCNGLWLLRKDAFTSRSWNSSNVNDYENSTIHSYLNSTFLNLLGSVEKAAIKQVKIPYRAGSAVSSTVTSGANGLSTKIFLLSGYEVGIVGFKSTYYPRDGAKLSYFENGDTSGGTNRAKRIAQRNGSVVAWWLRSPRTDIEGFAWNVSANGSFLGSVTCSSSSGVRPAFILPSTALFDEETMLLKGVA